MRVQKAVSFDDWLKKQLKSKSFRKHYEQCKLAVEIGHAITALRARMHLSQAELAERMGTKQQTISRLESGEYEGFTLKTLMKLAEATRTELVVQFKPTRRQKVRVG
jgi:DNA-binding XRE family transcriptional regulator